MQIPLAVKHRCAVRDGNAPHSIRSRVVQAGRRTELLAAALCERVTEHLS